MSIFSSITFSRINEASLNDRQSLDQLATSSNDGLARGRGGRPQLVDHVQSLYELDGQFAAATY